MTPTKPQSDSSRNTRSNKQIGSQRISNSTPTLTSNAAKLNEENTKLQKILETNNLLLVQNKEILQKMNDIESAMQFLSNKYDELKNMYEKVTAENTSLKKVNIEITNKCEEIQNDNSDMHFSINELKQNELKNNLVVFGAPSVRDQKSLQLTFKHILTQLDIPHDQLQIDDIFQKKNNSAQSPIFIKFRTLQQKIDFKQAAKTSMINKNKYLHANDIGFSTANNNKIIFVDQLTENNRNLLREAKLLRAHGYKYIWTVNGKILVKKNEDTDTLVIKNLNCIDSLKPHNSTM